ncbi:GerAB/ArcD/ProY family transporter [Mycoplasmatota bacterium]|nr:GerAB/ArcD/ProY family transporter [Mycoplasmatota bacterium]
MFRNKGKISVRQVMIILIITVYTPSIRFIARATSYSAKQASWLSPIIAFGVYVIMLFILNRFYKKYKNKNFSEVILDNTPKLIGKTIIVIYIISITLLLVLYIRYFGERFVTALYPNVDINIFIISILLIVAFMIRSGIVVIARMSELMFIIMTIIFVSLMFIMVPNVQLENVTPISTLDIIPVFKGSIVTIALSYLPFYFFFSHEWSQNDKFLKHGIMAGLYILIIEVLIIFVSVGLMGSTVISRSPLSFFIAVKNINLLGEISGFESILVSTWILTDFVILIVYTYSALNMIKSLFNLGDFKPFINIYIFITYLLTWIIAKNVFELQDWGAQFAVYMNINVLIVIPVIIFMIGKVRKVV